MNAKTHSQQRPFTVAAIQFNPEIFEFDRNVDRACAVIEEAAVKGARLIVLPEAALSGYIYRDLDQFLPFMDTVPGVATTRIAEVTAQYDCYVAIGIAEVDKASGLTYNTGALIGPRGFIGKYRKNGLNPSDIDWFAPGNTGYPVFQTELGAIAMVICYDDTYWEPGRLPMLKGADIIAYICSSDRPIPKATDSASVSAHSTIAAVQQLVAWNGLAMVAADRNNAETNPTTGVTVTYGGAASIWQATGERIAHAPATDYTNTMANPGSILYAEIDPSRFDNDQRRTIDRRRPDLYGPLAYFRAPIDPRATTTGQTISATALQYRTVPGDFDGNVQRAMALADRLAGTEPASGLLVLPAFSFTGRPASDSQAGDFSEAGYGRTVQVLGEMAARLGRHVVGSHIETDEGCLFHTCVLVGTDGTVAGTYRQTHPDPWMTWASAGNSLNVFDTAIGRIGMLACEDVRFPEASGVLAVRRADIIAVPTSWDGSYGGPLHDAGGLFAHQYPANTMSQWYATAKCSQAYTVVANAVNDGMQGSSGVFTVNPVDSAEPPVVGSVDVEEIVTATITTLGDPAWFMNQSRLVGGRRADLAVPVARDPASDAFRRWRERPGWDASGWESYAQEA